MDAKGLANWESAASNWRHRPPISPGPEDVAWYESVALGAAADTAPLRAMLLGVTAKIATMSWPAGTQLLVVDWAEAVIKTAWLRTGLPHNAHVVRADWFSMPLARAARDVVFGDGCYTALGSLEYSSALNRAVSRVLRPGGIFAIRCFSRSEAPADVDQLFEELFSGRYQDLGLFRWLLMMALQGSERQGVRLDELWRVWNERVPRPEEHIKRLNWIPEELASIERYSTQDVRYVYPTITELHEIAAPDFDVANCDIPKYPYGQHFPLMTLVKKS